MFARINDGGVQRCSTDCCFFAEQLNYDAILESNILQVNGHRIFQDTVIMGDASTFDGAAVGRSSARKIDPLFRIQSEGLLILLVTVDNQDSLVGNNIILGLPGGQSPVLVCFLGSDAAGQERIRTSRLLRGIQRGDGQQGLAAVQLDLDACHEGNVLQFNRHSVL